MQYLFRPIKGAKHYAYEVTKFNGEYPADTYRVYQNAASAQMTCTCPAWTTNCKHIKMIKYLHDEGIKGDGVVGHSYDDVDDEWSYTGFLDGRAK